MPYIVTTTSGTAIATIPDNTVNTTTTSITLVGKNYAGYGAFLNENYVKMLENFSNSIAPTAPLVGQLWYDSTNTLLKVWTGSQWKPMHTSSAQNTAPTGPITGDLWWDTTNLLLKVWGGSAWLAVGSGTSGSGTGSTGGGGSSSTTGALVDTIIDTTSLSHAVIKFSISNQVIAIVSKDTTFTPSTGITGFTQIQPGLNLINSTGFTFTGLATNALAVNNISSNSFLTSVADQTTAYKLTVGKLQAGSDLLLDPSTAGEVQVYSNGNLGSGTGKDLNLYVNKAGIQTKAIGITAATGAVTTIGAVTVGTSLSVGTTVSATGAITSSSTITASGGMIAGGAITVNSATTAVINSGTTGQGNIGAIGATFNTVYAKATTAVYADLAEIYATDTEYSIGTVVKIGGSAEVTAAIYGDRAIGVISANPAFLMNNSAKGQPVALKGRVPVKVQGTVRKGDKLIPAQNIFGAASTIIDKNDPDYFAIALEDHQQGSGIIECLIL
jgi:hypothetical protein